MPELQHFHETRFPVDISLGVIGGPVRRTEIVSLVSGHEKRNTRWADSRRNFNAGYGVKTIDDLQEVIAFFEERRGRLYGFRFRDPLDFKSCKSSQGISASDQFLGIGDGVLTKYQLRKQYGLQPTGYYRNIQKPTGSTLLIAVNGNVQNEGVDFTIDDTTGEVFFLPASIPAVNEPVTAGYEFDVPVRFDTDEIAVNLSAFKAGEIPSIPLIEIKS
ncbi:MAG: DUF2460 domain-containing protein [Rhizobiaceae bacterium]|nr:DUF2460 domain-containing protein [Rhizobiaceae bacterium]